MLKFLVIIFAIFIFFLVFIVYILKRVKKAIANLFSSSQNFSQTMHQNNQDDEVLYKSGETVILKGEAKK